MTVSSTSPLAPALGRGAYALSGLLLFGLKHNLDRVVASAFFDKSWSLFNYLVPPEHGGSLLRLTPAEMRFYGTLLLVALPFIAIGVVLTLRRLRSAGLPLPLVVLFFLPLVNLVFFLVLCIVPARGDGPRETAGACSWRDPSRAPSPFSGVLWATSCRGAPAPPRFRPPASPPSPSAPRS